MAGACGAVTTSVTAAVPARGRGLPRPWRLERADCCRRTRAPSPGAPPEPPTARAPLPPGRRSRAAGAGGRALQGTAGSGWPLVSGFERLLAASLHSLPDSLPVPGRDAHAGQPKCLPTRFLLGEEGPPSPRVPDAPSPWLRVGLATWDPSAARKGLTGAPGAHRRPRDRA